MRAVIISPDQQLLRLAGAVRELDDRPEPRRGRGPRPPELALVRLVADRLLAEELDPVEAAAPGSTRPSP